MISKVREYIENKIGHSIFAKVYHYEGESFAFVDVYHLICQSDISTGWGYDEKHLAALTVWETNTNAHPQDEIEDLWMCEDYYFGSSWHEYEISRVEDLL